ncbi:riboflavin synthase [Spirochaetota bacterium]
MFTGLIEDVGFIKSIKEAGEGKVLEIASQKICTGTAIGDSVSINGACQTVTEIGKDSLKVFVSRITSSVTTLGNIKVNARVNLERAMLPVSRFGGHIVQGHVDGTGIIKNIKDDTTGRQITINCDLKFLRYMVDKGSITVDGISLTIVSLTNEGFVIYIIPETMGNTTVNDYKAGQEINIEVDILAKYVERMLKFKDSSVSEENDKEFKKKLFEEGFI